MMTPFLGVPFGSTSKQCNCMPTCLLKIVQNLYDADEYVLVDGTKQASVRPTRGVKQGCPLSPLLFSL